MKKMYTHLLQSRIWARVSSIQKLVLVIAVLCPYSFNARAQTPVVTISSPTVCTGTTLTLTSNIQPAKIVWTQNGTTVSTQLETWASAATTVAGGGTGYTFGGPTGTFVDGSGNIYVADYINNNIVKFNAGSTTGTVVAGSTSGTSGTSTTLLNHPTNIFVDASGNLYVVDAGNNRIQYFASGSSTGSTVAGSSSGTSGTSSTLLNAPFGVYVDGSGNIYVADQGNNRIQRFPSGSTTATTIVGSATGTSGNTSSLLNAPSSVYVDGSGNIYVADYGNNRIQLFASGSTTAVTIAGGNGSGTGANQLNGPTNIWVDGLGNVYIADAQNHRVQQFPAGSSSTTSGTTIAGTTAVSGSSASLLNLPYSISFDKSSNLYVADYNNGRIQKFNASINGNTTTFTYPGTTAGVWNATVTTFAGNSATSSNITVNDPPSITVQPTTPATICAGSNATVSVTAAGGGLTYKWQANGTPINDGGVYSGTATNTLNITGATAGMNGTVYRVLVSGTCTPTALSNGVTLTVNAPVAITGNPSNIAVCSGNNTTFTGAATGTGLTYQWQVNTGGGYSNITNGGVYSGATTSTLSLTNVPAGYNGYLYQLIVKGTCTPAGVTTSAATLTVNPSPVITSNPSDATVCVGGTAVFTTTATVGGISTLSYQWKVNRNDGNGFVNVPAGPLTFPTTPTLTITAITAAQNGYQYQCIITSSPGNCVAATSVATLTVNAPPAIISNPPTDTVCPGNTAVYGISATGYNLTYQWQYSSTGVGGTYLPLTDAAGSISGSQTNTLSVINVTAGMNGYFYRAVVSGGCLPPVTTTAGKLVIFQQAVITNQPAPATTTRCAGGAAVTYSVSAVGVGLTYNWFFDRGDGTGPQSVNTLAAGGRTEFSGATTNTLTINPPTNADSGTYYVAVSGPCAATVNSNSVVLKAYVIPATPVVTFPFTPDTVCSGSPVSFAAATTTPFSTATYQWTGTGGFSSTLATPSVIDTVATGNTYANYTYNATITINGCTSLPGSRTLTVLQIPRPANPYTTPLGPICVGTPITLNAVPDPSGTGTVNWINGGASGTFNSTLPNPTISSVAPNDSGSYCVYNSFPNGCVSVPQCVNIYIANATATPIPSPNPLIVCQGSSLDLSLNLLGVSASTSYSWTAPSGTKYSGANPHITNTAASTDAGLYSVVASLKTSFPWANYNYNYAPYNVTVVPTDVTCPSAAAYDTVKVNPLPPNPTNTRNNGPVCLGSLLVLTTDSAVVGETFQWTGPQWSGPVNGKTQTVSSVPWSDTTGKFYVRTFLNGCASKFMDSTKVTIIPLPGIATISSNAPVCYEDTIKFHATDDTLGVSYVWTSSNGNGFTTDISANPIIARAALTDTGTYCVVAKKNGCTSPIPVCIYVDVKPRPSAAYANSNSPICFGGVLHLSSSSNTPGVSFSWTGPSSAGPNGFTSLSQNPNRPSMTFSDSGDYTVYSVLNGCATDTPGKTHVSVKPVPADPTATSNSPVCSGDTLFLYANDATAGVNYSWTGPAFSAPNTNRNPVLPNATTAYTGNYSVYAFLNGCSSVNPAVITATVNQTPNPPAITDVFLCQNAPVTPLAAIGQNLLWYTVATGGIGSPTAPTPTDALPGVTTYYVTQTIADGCTSKRAPLVVTVNQESIPPTVTNPVLTYCQNDSAGPLSANGVNLLWYTTATGGVGSQIAPTPQTITSGTTIYYVSQNVNGCESERVPISVNVRLKPQPPIVQDATYCQGEPAVPLSAIGQNIVWYVSPKGGVGTTVAPVPVTDFPDTINYYVTQNINGCESDRVLQKITVLVKPNAVIAPTSPYVCQFSTDTFTYFGSAYPDASFNWSLPTGAVILRGTTGFGGDSLVVRFDTPGKQVITLVVGNGTCMSDPATFVVDVRKLTEMHISSTHDVCMDSIIQIGLSNVTPGVTNYAWDFDGGTVISSSGRGGPFSVSYPTAGIHIVSLVATLNGCPSLPARDTITVNALPDAGIGTISANNICTGDSVYFEARTIKDGFLYQWSPNGFFLYGNNKPTVSANVSYTGYVTLTVTNEFGCVASDSVLMTTLPCCNIMFPNAFSPNGDSKNDIFRPITKGNHKMKTFRVVNRFGQTVFETTNEKDGWDGNYNGVPQDLGSYFWYVNYICTYNNKEMSDHGEVTLVR